MTDCFVPDDDIVLAAFDFIDSFDNDTLASPPKRRRMHSGQRVRAEIQRLRASVVALEAEFQSLQKRKQNATELNEANALVSRSWEEVAKRQKTQCGRVQRENNHLRALLTYQTRVARNLERVAVRLRRSEKKPDRLVKVNGAQCISSVINRAMIYNHRLSRRAVSKA